MPAHPTNRQLRPQEGRVPDAGPGPGTAGLPRPPSAGQPTPDSAWQAVKAAIKGIAQKPESASCFPPKCFPEQVLPFHLLLAYPHPTCPEAGAKETLQPKGRAAS